MQVQIYFKNHIENLSLNLNFRITCYPRYIHSLYFQLLLLEDLYLYRSNPNHTITTKTKTPLLGKQYASTGNWVSSLYTLLLQTPRPKKTLNSKKHHQEYRGISKKRSKASSSVVDMSFPPSQGQCLLTQVLGPWAKQSASEIDI